MSTLNNIIVFSHDINFVITINNIQNSLNKYQYVDDIYTIPINTRIKYFLKCQIPNVYTFYDKLHSKLYHINIKDQYVILYNNTKMWSVNISQIIFYQKIKHKKSYIRPLKIRKI
jgi:hypothetical protein